MREAEERARRKALIQQIALSRKQRSSQSKSSNIVHGRNERRRILEDSSDGNDDDSDSDVSEECSDGSCEVQAAQQEMHANREENVSQRGLSFTLEKEKAVPSDVSTYRVERENFRKRSDDGIANPISQEEIELLTSCSPSAASSSSAASHLSYEVEVNKDQSAEIDLTQHVKKCTNDLNLMETKKVVNTDGRDGGSRLHMFDHRKAAKDRIYYSNMIKEDIILELDALQLSSNRKEERQNSCHSTSTPKLVEGSQGNHQDLRSWKGDLEKDSKAQHSDNIEKLNECKALKESCAIRSQPEKKFDLSVKDSYGFCISPHLEQILYPHQREGVQWMYNLFKVGSGGILADDMGLGKTLQVSAYLSGLLKNKLIRRACIVAPKTLLAAWKKELAVCELGDVSKGYYGTSTERTEALDSTIRGCGVLLTTYGMILHNASNLSDHPDCDDELLWDILVMDEGHKLKNPKMQLRACIESLPVKQRILITGTPIQNNLMEMHALVDLVRPNLLGDSACFRAQYEKVIKSGSDKFATLGERQRGAAKASELRKIVQPFMLRREKEKVFGAAARNVASDDNAQKSEIAKHILNESCISHSCAHDQTDTKVSSAGPSALPARKNDLVVWVQLKGLQRCLYEAFLNSKAVKEALNRTSSPLAALTVLKKICDHPALLSAKAQEGIIAGARRSVKRSKRSATKKGENSKEFNFNEKIMSDESSADSENSRSDDEKDEVSSEEEESDTTIEHQLFMKALKYPTSKREDTNTITDFTEELFRQLQSMDLQASCKTAFVLRLLTKLVSEGHRTLVFSQSKRMLDILEAGILTNGWKICRIDGSVSSAEERQRRVELFQSDSSIPIFLLTSQVGGLGLTLTAADRVIIVDPAWNPSVDSQSVDRAYRIGQKKDVVVYRLISCGTVEDKIYRNQVFKGGLFRTGTEVGEQFRYFSAADLRDLFRLDPIEASVSSTQRHLSSLHSHQRQATMELEKHIKFLESLEGVSGVSDHDLLYSLKESNSVKESDRHVGRNFLIRSQIHERKIGSSQVTGRPESNNFFCVPAGRTQGHKSRSLSSSIRPRSQQMWSGRTDISSMFPKSLAINEKYEIIGVDEVPTWSRVESAQKLSAIGSDEIAHLKAQLTSQKSLLANKTLISGLADKGKRVHDRVAELELLLETEKMKEQERKKGVSNHKHEVGINPDIALEEAGGTGIVGSSGVRYPRHSEQTIEEMSSKKITSREIKKKLYEKALRLEELERQKIPCPSQDILQLRDEVEELADQWERSK